MTTVKPFNPAEPIPEGWALDADGARAAGCRWSYGSRSGAGGGSTQTSLTGSPLSRAKFITKSQAIGSMPRSASFTSTHFTPSTTCGTQ